MTAPGVTPLYSVEKPIQKPGFTIIRNLLDEAAQRKFVSEIAPYMSKNLYHPRMKNGTTFQVTQTNFGPYGWVSDKSGYRYQQSHPVTGEVWPNPTESMWLLENLLIESGKFLDTFNIARPYTDSWLVNYYAPGTQLGFHRDKDEKHNHAIYCISLGRSAWLDLRDNLVTGPVSAFTIRSGDVYVLDGKARTSYHRVIVPPTYDPEENKKMKGPLTELFDGRISITARVSQ